MFYKILRTEIVIKTYELIINAMDDTEALARAQTGPIEYVVNKDAVRLLNNSTEDKTEAVIQDVKDENIWEV
jgi:Skp family chaperone for outer membrane proteins